MVGLWRLELQTSTVSIDLEKMGRDNGDGKPEHQIPFTPLGLERFKLTKPSNSPRQSPLGDINDPLYPYPASQGFVYHISQGPSYGGPGSVLALTIAGHGVGHRSILE